MNAQLPRALAPEPLFKIVPRYMLTLAFRIPALTPRDGALLGLGHVLLKGRSLFPAGCACSSKWVKRRGNVPALCRFSQRSSDSRRSQSAPALGCESFLKLGCFFCVGYSGPRQSLTKSFEGSDWIVPLIAKQVLQHAETRVARKGKPRPASCHRSH